MWALALSGLLIAGGGVWARSRSEQGEPQTVSQTQTGQLPQAGSAAHADGRGGPQGPTRIGPPPSPLNVGWPWWQDDEVKKEIGLRPDQAKRIDDYYSRRMKEIDPTVQEYRKESALLDKMVTDRLVDDSTLSLELTKYYALRTSLGQSRTMMDYRIAKVLDLEQYAKLKAIADRRLKEAEARRGRGGGLAPSPGGLLR